MYLKGILQFGFAETETPRDARIVLPADAGVRVQ